ncbi:MAG TPA: hypothetical protein VN554_02185 [Verrucomicrobiae bacterium]|nr:hypothetical protein [Verrucomicrobiae bacterium]
MRRIQRLRIAMMMVPVLTGLLAAPWSMRPVAADAANPSLTISQLKITSGNGQFITLYNATDATLDMSRYQLEYFNSYDLGKATSSKLIALSGTIPPHGYFMVNDDALLLCYQLTVDSLSLGLSSSAGMVEVLAFTQSASGGPATPALQDYVGWSKAAAPGAQTLPSASDAFLQRAPAATGGNPQVTAPGTGSWQTVQPDPANPCRLLSTASGTPVASPAGLGQLLPEGDPPATILEAAQPSGGTPAPSLPAADFGLQAPSVTELLPNPNGTGNDSTNEFIELYNPNAATFDLTGFSLQAGTSLPARSFIAFYSATTRLSLSNGGGQAKLLDPFGNSISASGMYAAAADGQSWALAKGKWYWTTVITPGKPNAIKLPPAKKASTKTTAKSKTAKTTATKIKAGKTAATGGGQDDPVTSPIHVRILALVAGLALLYGAYEYRADLANRIYKFRQHFGRGYEDRP